MKSLQRFWHRNSPQLFLGELLEKRWMEPIIPFMLTIAVFLAFAFTIPRYTSLGNLQQLMLNFAEQGMVAIAMAFSVLSGGIDLSVGSVFAMSNFLALYFFLILGLPLPVMIVAVLLFGALMGAINGGMIAYGKTRPFLTTLVVLIIVRAAYNKVTAAFTEELASINSDSTVWDFMGGGTILGVPTNMAVLIVVAIATHFFLTRARPGVHIMAVGSSRKAARHAGVNVKWALFSAYVISGTLTALAGIFYAARQNSSGTDTGMGWEINALAAVVLGGISLSGGRGTIARAMMGAAIIFMLISGLVQTGVSGNFTTAIIGIILLVAVGFNVKWVKNKGKVLQKVYVVPSWVDFEPPPSIARDSGTVFAENDRLRERRSHRAQPDRGTGRHHSRPPGQPLHRQPQRLDHSLPGARLYGTRGIRPHRRPPARPRFRPRAKPAGLHRWHGGLRRQAGSHRFQGDRPYQPDPHPPQGRFPSLSGRRPRRRARWQDLFQRSHHALRIDRLGARRFRGPRQWTADLP